jgi:hypothetical protein
MAIPNLFKNLKGTVTTPIEDDVFKGAMSIGPSQYDEILKNKEEIYRQKYEAMTNAHMYGQQTMAKYPLYASSDAPDELYDLAVRAIETAKGRDIDSISADGEIKREVVVHPTFNLNAGSGTKLDRLKNSLGASFSERQTKQLLAMIDKAIIDVEREATRVRLSTFLVGGF